MNFINDSAHMCYFLPSIIVEPKLRENMVFIDLPCTLLQNPLHQVIHHSTEHLYYKLPFQIDKENPIDSIIDIFYQVQDFLIEIGSEYFNFYDPSIESYKNAVTYSLFFCFLLLKEQLIKNQCFEEKGVEK